MESEKRAATRHANMERIKRTARELLARDGATGLSLREVARDMGQTSSALYRYFRNRDELLTALIIDAYNDLGVVAERAEARVARADTRGRWTATCRAIRRWAKVHPHEYALIFGSPIPGYQAPVATVAAATRVTFVMASIVADQYRDSTKPPVHDDSFDRMLQWDGVNQIMPHVPRDVAVRAIFVWTQIYGFVSFELFGHLVGSVKNADAIFTQLMKETADSLGLTFTL